jgi:hypothetical protein
MSHQSDLIAEDINAYLAQHEQKELLRFLTCGSVDDGKSTLIGRLLYDSKMIYEDQLAAYKLSASRALLLMLPIVIFRQPSVNLLLRIPQGTSNTHATWQPVHLLAILQLF